MGLRRTLAGLLPYSPWGDKYHDIVNFRRRHHYWPRLRGPRTFNEHLLRLRIDHLGDEKRRYVSDKIQLKTFVADTVGSRYVIPTLGIIDTVAALHAFDFPARCVVKPAHASGQVFVRKSARDPVPMQQLEAWLALDYYRHSRERNYLGLQQRLIVEQFVDYGDECPIDYKLFCFFGRVKMIQVDIGRFDRHQRRIYSPDWQPFDFTQNQHPLAPVQQPPENLDEMIAVAERLAENLSPIRIDLYSNGEEIRVGELTNCHTGGAGRFDPPEFDRKLGPLFERPEFQLVELRGS